MLLRGCGILGQRAAFMGSRAMADHPGYTHRAQGGPDLARRLLPRSPRPRLAPLNHAFLSVLPACRWERRPGRQLVGKAPLEMQAQS